jgi:hypothetical protein
MHVESCQQQHFIYNSNSNAASRKAERDAPSDLRDHIFHPYSIANLTTDSLSWIASVNIGLELLLHNKWSAFLP